MRFGHYKIPLLLDAFFYARWVFRQFLTEWNEKKGRILTNVTVEPETTTGLTKRSAADCLQTRPIDHRERLVSVIGELSTDVMRQIDSALKIVFALN